MRLACALVLLAVSTAVAAPLDDLASPVQATRDAAAKSLRGTYKPAPRSKWQAVADSVKVGMERDAIVKLLEPNKPTTEAIATSGKYGITIRYRLDENWVLECEYHHKEHKLVKAQLVENRRRFWVDPPKDFTGTWTVYWANGERSHEIHYKNGKFFGAFTTFKDDGSKADAQNYGADGKVTH